LTSYRLPKKYRRRVYRTPDNITHITPRDPEGEPDPARPWEIELATWLYRAIIRQRDLLAVHPDYFRLTGGIERWLYRLARKAVPEKVTPPEIRFRLETLFEISGLTGRLRFPQGTRAHRRRGAASRARRPDQTQRPARAGYALPRLHETGPHAAFYCRHRACPPGAGHSHHTSTAGERDASRPQDYYLVNLGRGDRDQGRPAGAHFPGRHFPSLALGPPGCNPPAAPRGKRRDTVPSTIRLRLVYDGVDGAPGRRAGRQDPASHHQGDPEGTLSAEKDAAGEWRIEPAELFRVYTTTGMQLMLTTSCNHASSRTKPVVTWHG
jgi:Replication initiator protein A